MESGTWQDDWPFRIYERIQSRGFYSLSQFIDSRPMRSLLSLAEELGPGIAAIQLESLWFREAYQQGTLDHALASLLIRRIRENIPGGWASGDEFLSHLSGGFASWRRIAKALLPDDEQMRLWEFVRDLAAEPGWLPTVPPDDLTAQLLHQLELALHRSRPAT